MSFNYRSIFLRLSFRIDNVGEIGVLRLGAFVDDGFIAWINGTEALRVNVNTSNPTIQTLAEGAANEPPAFTIHEMPDSSAYLREGENVLASRYSTPRSTARILDSTRRSNRSVTETIPRVVGSISPTPGTFSPIEAITVVF